MLSRNRSSVLPLLLLKLLLCMSCLWGGGRHVSGGACGAAAQTQAMAWRAPRAPSREAASPSQGGELSDL